MCPVPSCPPPPPPLAWGLKLVSSADTFRREECWGLPGEGGDYGVGVNDIRGDLLGGGSEVWMGPRLEAEGSSLLPPRAPEAGAQPLDVRVSCFSFSALISGPHVAFHNMEEIRWPPHRAAVCEAPGTCLEALQGSAGLSWAQG